MGCFANPDWGTIHLEFSRGTLHGNQGDLPVLLSLRGSNEFVASYGIGTARPGRFEVREGEVTAFVLDPSSVWDQDIRYERCAR